MEALAIHPNRDSFAMGGRLRGGEWNVAIFSMHDGHRLATLKTGFRVTSLRFTEDGDHLVVMGANGQPKPCKNGQTDPFGRCEIYKVTIPHTDPIDRTD